MTNKHHIYMTKVRPLKCILILERLRPSFESVIELQKGLDCAPLYCSASHASHVNDVSLSCGGLTMGLSVQDGRISLAGLPASKAEYLAKAIDDSVRNA